MPTDSAPNPDDGDLAGLEDPSLFGLANVAKTRPLERRPPPPLPTFDDPGGGPDAEGDFEGDDDYDDYGPPMPQTHPFGQPPPPPPQRFDAVTEETVEQARRIQESKLDALAKLHRLCERHKRPLPNLTMRDSLDDIQLQLEAVKRQIEIEHSIAMQRRLMMTSISTLEWLNGQYDPLSMDLDGWSETVMTNIDEYDGVFEKLHDKYKDRMTCPPEIQLILMVGGSAFMFSMSKSVQKQSISAPPPPPAASTPPPPPPSTTPPAPGRAEEALPGVNATYVMRGPLSAPPPQLFPPRSPPLAPPLQEPGMTRPPPPSPTVYSEITDLSADDKDPDARTIAVTAGAKVVSKGRRSKSSKDAGMILNL